MFDHEKQKTLKELEEGIDRSRKGSIDKHIRNLVNIINKNENYYTTSSCSGRIMISTENLDKKRYETKWLMVSHEIIENTENAWNILLETKEDVWLKFEPAVLHVASRTIEDANKFLKLVRECGFKRSGIISLKRNIIEVMSTEKIDMPLKMDGELFITRKQFDKIILLANNKLKRTHKKISLVEERMQ